MTDTPIDTPRRGPGHPPMQRTSAPVETVKFNPESDAGPRKSTRKPFGSMNLKLAYPDRVGFHRHWFNETPGRIQRAQEAGYEHVTTDGKPVSKVVGTAEGGGALTAFLMEIPEEWYTEDMAAQQREIDEKEKSIKERQMDGNAADRESLYGKVSIQQGK
jgi:hypothetical protein